MAYGRSTRAGMKRKTSRRAYTPTRRRRKTSGIGKMDVTSIGGIMAGSIGAQFLDKLPFYSTLDPKIQSAVKIALGVAGPQFIKGAFAKGAFDGILASGAADLASDFGLVSGIGKYIHGIGGHDVPTIAAMSTAQSRGDQLNELTGSTMTFHDGDVPTIAGIEGLI